MIMWQNKRPGVIMWQSKRPGVIFFRSEAKEDHMIFFGSHVIFFGLPGVIFFGSEATPSDTSEADPY